MAAVVVVLIVFGCLCGFIGESKGRSGFGWFMGGVAFGVFALIAVCAVPSIKE